jgi:hypothetical protein
MGRVSGRRPLVGKGGFGRFSRLSRFSRFSHFSRLSRLSRFSREICEFAAQVLGGNQIWLPRETASELPRSLGGLPSELTDRNHG